MIRRYKSLIGAMLLVACAWQPVSALSAEEAAKTPLQQSLSELAARARPGVLGITVLDLDSGAQVHINADRAYPMMSVFKAPVAATVLSQVDAPCLTWIAVRRRTSTPTAPIR